MANFCTKCGKKLVDGQPCDCQSTTSKQTVDTATNIDIASIGKNLLNKCIKLFTNPKEAIMMEDNSIITPIIVVVMTALCGVVLLKILSFAIMALLSSLLGYSAYYMFDGGLAFTLGDYIKVFVGGLIGSMLYMAVLSGGVYLIGKMVKKEVDYKIVLINTSVFTLISLITAFLAAISLYIHFSIAILFILIGFVYFALVMYQYLIKLFGEEVNLILFTTLLIAITGLINGVITSLINKF